MGKEPRNGKKFISLLRKEKKKKKQRKINRKKKKKRKENTLNQRGVNGSDAQLRIHYFVQLHVI